jgi:hypothetical protein
MVCEYCNFIAKNQQALSAHQRGCLVRKNMTKSEILTTIHTDVKTNNSAASSPSPATAVKDTNVIVKDTSVKDKIIKEIIKDKKTKLNM